MNNIHGVKRSLLTVLRLLFGGMSVYMLYLVIVTSNQSNLWEVLPELTRQPWFNTTIVDFYFNIVIIALWVVYKETNFLAALLWIVSFVCLGSITTSLYVFIQLIKLKPEDDFAELFTRREARV